MNGLFLRRKTILANKNINSRKKNTHTNYDAPLLLFDEKSGSSHSKYFDLDDALQKFDEKKIYSVQRHLQAKQLKKMIEEQVIAILNEIKITPAVLSYIKEADEIERKFDQLEMYIKLLEDGY